MATAPSPPSYSPTMASDEADLTAKMDRLLNQLQNSVAELILQGDDVTQQMWHMYSVFEDLFGRQTMTTSTNEPLKHVVVGDKGAAARNKPQPRTTTTTTSPISASSPVSKSEPPVSSSPVTSEVAAAASTTTVAASIVSSPTLSETTVSTPKDTIKAQIEDVQSSASTESNVPTFSPILLSHSSPATKSSSPSSEKSLDNHPHHLHEQQSRLLQQRESSSSSEPLATNPLLATIGGALASSNPDSDDSSDLDIVYQQLRYNRGRHRKQPQQEHMRIKTTHQRQIHRHPQPGGTTSDPEFIGYAGSNSIDSGYKSLCATPEVSDTLSAQEVRRSASDVSASDSSTTSGKPRSVNGSQQDAKIRMGTRSISTKLKPIDRSPRHVSVGSSMNDVTLDHLMYLRQSLRKDRSDMSRSDSIPSFRDSDLSSPRTATEEEWRDSRTSFHSTASNSPSSDSAFMGRSSRSSSRGDEVEQEGGGESSSDFLLSGVEYYDLESIQEFPPSNNYVTMLEEKTRCSRFKLISSPKCSEPITERQLNSMYRRRNESSQSVDGDIPRSHHHQQPQNIYGLAGHPSRIMRHPKQPSHHHPRPHHATDSKLTEAAIRVLEMIEDFRMEEAMTRSGRLVSYQAHGEPPQASASGANSRYPSLDLIQQQVMPRYRKSRSSSSSRPASTGSLMEQEIDARSVASASSYAASAEHHVYEEIMYDLVCERGMPTHHMQPSERSRMAARSRLLPVPPHIARHQQQQGVPVDPRRMMVRSHKQRNSNMYSVLPNPHDRGNVDRFLEIEWQLAQERRGSLPPDFPV